jgi:starch synthase
MTILFAASEIAPLASTGGLGETMASLPRVVSAQGHDAAVALPGYPALLESAEPLEVEFDVIVGSKTLHASIYDRTLPDGTQLLLIRNDALFGRTGLYCDPQNNEPFADNAERFIFFSKAVVELAKRMDPTPAVVHAHDWQTALVPVLIREQALPIRTVLTLHNVAFQGNFLGVDFQLTNLHPQWMSPSGLEFFGSMNLLKGGILAADALTTVSKRYREEILNSPRGCGLEGPLRSRAAELISVPIGVDPARWSPSHPDAAANLAAAFSAAEPLGKTKCRAALLAETGLPPDAEAPVFVMLGRLADQKGFDLLLPLVPKILSTDARLIIAGDGDVLLHRELLIACRRHPGKLAFMHSWQPGFPQRLMAGGDILLMPSHFEPGGLAPLHALAYGTVPIAHAVGGLADNLTNFVPAECSGNSLLYYLDNEEALMDAVVRGKLLFRNKPVWNRLVQNAFASKFPWEKTAAALDSLYHRIVGPA